MTAIDRTLEGAMRRDRLVTLAALALLVLLSWAYLLTGAGTGMSLLPPSEEGMQGMAGMMTPATWTFGYAVVIFFMWWVMMLAMMLPSAAPMILLFAAINRKQRERGNPAVPTSLFAAAYLLAWGLFSLLAAALQWGLEASGLLSPMMASNSAVLGGILLLLAGLYQMTPLKQACLKHCRSPLSFIMTRWRPGAAGAIRMGMEHGTFCLGCCWFLMGLLFFGGVMNLYWILGLALLVLLEKTIPGGHWLSYALGLGLSAWGLWMLFTAV